MRENEVEAISAKDCRVRMGDGVLAKILVVEDDIDSLLALAKLLRLAGYDVDVANGYGAALELGRRDHFDLVLCDIGLWDGDGCDLFQKLKETEAERGTPHLIDGTNHSR